jgi:ribonuclease-3
MIQNELKLKDTSIIEDYNRLEFLGDSFIDLYVAEYLFKKYKDYNVGKLTKIRVEYVNRKKLNKLMMNSKLINYIMFSGIQKIFNFLR